MVNSIDLFSVAVPMHSPFAHARASRSVAENIVVLVDFNGLSGVGESVPRDYVTGETLSSVMDAISGTDIPHLMKNLDRTSFASAVGSIERMNLPNRFREGSRLGNAAACALELALLDAIGKYFKSSLRQVPQALGLSMDKNKVNLSTVSITKVLNFASPLSNAAKTFPSHIKHLKVKVGLGLKEDLATLQKVREQFGYELPLSVDANMAWSLAEAIATEKELRPYKISWYEEPFAKGELDDCRRFREETGAQVMLDESLCTFEDGERSIEKKACEFFNIRISKCGGLIASIRLIELAKENNIGFQIGGQVGQSGILSTADGILASSVAGVVTWESFHAPTLLTDDLIVEPAQATPSNWLSAISPHGIGITADLVAIDKMARKSMHWNQTTSIWQLKER